MGPQPCNYGCEGLDEAGHSAAVVLRTPWLTGSFDYRPVPEVDLIGSFVQSPILSSVPLSSMPKSTALTRYTGRIMEKLYLSPFQIQGEVCSFCPPEKM
jgi:hypothetical protein